MKKSGSRRATAGKRLMLEILPEEKDPEAPGLKLGAWGLKKTEVRRWQ
jgi:hypothetical protein